MRLNTPALRVGLLAVALGMALAAPSAWSRSLDVVEGTVTDSSGEPVPSARVELSAGTRVLASAWTNRSGAFRIVTMEAYAPGWQVRVERLGYASTRIDVTSLPRSMAIVLLPAPLPLPGIQVEGESDLCSASENPLARRLWEAAVRLHGGGLDTLGIASYTEEWTDTLTSEAGDSMSTADGWVGQRTSAPLRRLSWSRRIEREGYAFPVRRSDLERSYDSWSYAPLEADLSPHFIGETFGSLHRFHVEIADTEGWILRFCGTERDRPFLEGALVLGTDTLIQRVEWEFTTPEPDEGAGGWSRFDPSGGSVPLLLPRESLTWRTLPDGGTIRRAQSYEGWITVLGDSVPFLPPRAGARPGEAIAEPPSGSPGP